MLARQGKGRIPFSIASPVAQAYSSLIQAGSFVLQSGPICSAFNGQCEYWPKDWALQDGALRFSTKNQSEDVQTMGAEI